MIIFYIRLTSLPKCAVTDRVLSLRHAMTLSLKALTTIWTFFFPKAFWVKYMTNNCVHFDDIVFFQSVNFNDVFSLPYFTMFWFFNGSTNSTFFVFFVIELFPIFLWHLLHRKLQKMRINYNCWLDVQSSKLNLRSISCERM